MTLLSICITFSGAMPLLYATASLFLAFFFWFNKTSLLKFNQRHSDFNERLILLSYDLLLLPLLAHLVLTMQMLRLSPMLRGFRYPPGHFQNTETVAQLTQRMQELPPELSHYNTFIWVVIILFIVYKLARNMFTSIRGLDGLCKRGNKREEIYKDEGDVVEQI